VRKESAFDRVVLAAVAGKVCDANRKADAIDQLLKIPLEKVFASRVAASTVARQGPVLNGTVEQ
jgi:hypothetical protein